jgi:hypothetical protein
VRGRLVELVEPYLERSHIGKLSAPRFDPQATNQLESRAVGCRDDYEFVVDVHTPPPVRATKATLTQFGSQRIVSRHVAVLLIAFYSGLSPLS